MAEFRQMAPALYERSKAYLPLRCYAHLINRHPFVCKSEIILYFVDEKTFAAQIIISMS